jgi:hypothetical protein
VDPVKKPLLIIISMAPHWRITSRLMGVMFPHHREEVEMKHYAAIDLHGTNSVVVVLDEADRVLSQQRPRNELARILAAFAPWRDTLQGIAVESPSKARRTSSLLQWGRGNSAAEIASAIEPRRVSDRATERELKAGREAFKRDFLEMCGGS